jgi:uncharacterized protein (TIGR00730 family)
MNALCVFCGSSPGLRPAYNTAASELGVLLAQLRIKLVYGGGNIGLMGTVADSCMAAGGEVVGVIPKALLDKEHGHRGITRLEVVASMHERKARMAALADGFLALPGGIGTLEELLEVMTWSQLGIHGKPVALVNVAGFFDPLLAFLDYTLAEGFMRVEHRRLLIAANRPQGALDQMRAVISSSQEHRSSLGI